MGDQKIGRGRRRKELRVSAVELRDVKFTGSTTKKERGEEQEEQLPPSTTSLQHNRGRSWIQGGSADTKA